MRGGRNQDFSGQSIHRLVYVFEVFILIADLVNYLFLALPSSELL